MMVDINEYVNSELNKLQGTKIDEFSDSKIAHLIQTTYENIIHYDALNVTCVRDGTNVSVNVNVDTDKIKNIFTFQPLGAHHEL
jgi:hypothetical protein